MRKKAEGEITCVLFGFLICEPNAEVGKVHPKAMPTILTTPDESGVWMSARAEEALKLQPPLPDGSLKVAARGAKQGGALE